MERILARVLTVDEIRKTLNEEGIPITREQFTYYSKIDLFFAPEKKTKVRKQEGIKSYYAAEIIERIKTIFKLRDEKGYSLNEIRKALKERDSDEIIKLYKEAGIELSPTGVKFKAKMWMKEGYYQGLENIYSDIISKLKIKENEIRVRAQTLDSINQKLLDKIRYQEDKKIIKTIFKYETSSLEKKRTDLLELIDKFSERDMEIDGFLEASGIIEKQYQLVVVR